MIKRILALCLLALPAWGQSPYYGGFSGTAANLVGTTSSCSVGAPDTANSVCLGSSAITGEGSSADANETVLTFADDGAESATYRFSSGMSGTSATSNFFNITGTMPSTNTAVNYGVRFVITPAGNANAQTYGFEAKLAAGWTGVNTGAASKALNQSTGTGSSETGGTGNLAFIGQSNGTTAGNNYGAWLQAANGTKSFGVVGLAQTAKNSGTNIGGLFLGRNTGTSPTQVGVYAGLGSGDPTYASAALIADNSDQTSPIFIARDNGTAVFTIGDGGTTSLIAGTGTGRVSVGGVLCKDAPAQATTGTSEEVLATCTIPAATLTASGSTVRVKLFAHTAANGNNKTLRVRIGGIGGTIVCSSGTITSNNLDVSTDSCDIRRTGASTATAYASFIIGTDSATAASIAGVYSLLRAASITWANANDLVVTGTTPTSAGDLTLDSYTVEVAQ